MLQPRLTGPKAFFMTSGILTIWSLLIEQYRKRKEQLAKRELNILALTNELPRFDFTRLIPSFELPLSEIRRFLNLHDDNDRLKTENAGLKARLDSYQRRSDELEVSLADSEERCSSLKDQSEAHTADSRRMAAEIASLKAELDKIKEILSIARKNEQQTTKNHEEALARLKDLEHINALKIKELENLKDAQSLERTSQEKTIEELEKEVRDLKEALDERRERDLSLINAEAQTPRFMRNPEDNYNASCIDGSFNVTENDQRLDAYWKQENHGKNVEIATQAQYRNRLSSTPVFSIERNLRPRDSLGQEINEAEERSNNNDVFNSPFCGLPSATANTVKKRLFDLPISKLATSIGKGIHVDVDSVFEDIPDSGKVQQEKKKVESHEIGIQTDKTFLRRTLEKFGNFMPLGVLLFALFFYTFFCAIEIDGKVYLPYTWHPCFKFEPFRIFRKSLEVRAVNFVY